MTHVDMDVDQLDDAATSPQVQGLLKTLARIPDYARLVFRMLKDSRIALTDRTMVIVSLLYLASPFDFLPDMFPILGQVDDIFFLVFTITRLFEHAERHVVLSHWDGEPSELSPRSLRRLMLVASFFSTPRLRRKLRSLARPA